MTQLCATPGCHTLTFGQICLGCLQRLARAQRAARADEREATTPDEASAGDSGS